VQAQDQVRPSWPAAGHPSQPSQPGTLAQPGALAQPGQLGQGQPGQQPMYSPQGGTSPQPSYGYPSQQGYAPAYTEQGQQWAPQAQPYEQPGQGYEQRGQAYGQPGQPYGQQGQVYEQTQVLGGQGAQDHGQWQLPAPSRPQKPPKRPKMPKTPGQKGFVGSLFDFGFTSFVTPKIVKALYLIFTIWTFLWALAFLDIGIRYGHALGGFLTLVIVDPVFVLASLGVFRVVLEFFMVAFRMQEDLKALRDRGDSAADSLPGKVTDRSGDLT
jgi:hypothetical protein